MDIATGQAEDHPSLLPLDASYSPGVAPPTPIQPGQLTGPTYPGAPTTADYQAQQAQVEADCRAAQATGQAAENDRRQHYAADVLPVGAAYGDAMNLPPVPDQATPPASSDLYPYPGQEPTPAGVGFYHGNEPTLPQ